MVEEQEPIIEDVPPSTTKEGVESTRDQLHPSFWTWRFQSRLSFAYGTIPGRHYHHESASRRQPNPFGPSHQPFKRLRSLDMPALGASMAEVQPAKQAALSAPIVGAPPMTPAFASPNTGLFSSPPISPASPNDNRDIQSTRSHTSPALVTRHPPHPRWDDESDPELLYENPFYTKDFANSLWLPRDPCGVLNLDDTVELHRSLTSESRIGALGGWGGDEALDADDLGLSMIESIVSEGHEDAWDMPLVESPAELPAEQGGLTGNEEIDLPPVIAARVRQGESDVELAPRTPQRRPSLISRVSSGRLRKPSVDGSLQVQVPPVPPLPQRTPTGSRPGSGPRRASTLQPGTGFRSFSGSSTSRSSAHAPSFLSSPHRESFHGRRASRASADIEMGMRPDYHGQGGAAFTRSALSVVNSTATARTYHTASAGGTASRLRQHTRQPTMVVSTHDAVVEEVIREEQAAADMREAEENEEAEKAAQRRPWWSSWAFTSAEPPDDPTTAVVEGHDKVVAS